MRRSTLFIATAVTAAAAVVGIRAWAPSTTPAHPVQTGTETTASTTTPPAAQQSTGPSTVVNGIPHGWTDDPAGARAAAISAVGLTGDIARAGFITRTDLIRSLATARYGPTLATESAGQLSTMVAELAAGGVSTGTVVFSELPLTAHLDNADATTARVEVWSVLVAAGNGAMAPRQAWRTVAIDLLWESNDWRIDGWTARPGPTPALATNAPIATLDELAEVTAWPSTVRSL